MRRLIDAFWNSIAGLAWAARHETAVLQEIAVLVIAVPLSFLVASGHWQRLALIGSLVLLLTVELLNTAIEKLSDHVAPGHAAAIKAVKDMGSAAVLLAMALAAATWLIALVERLSS